MSLTNPSQPWSPPPGKLARDWCRQNFPSRLHQYAFLPNLYIALAPVHAFNHVYHGQSERVLKDGRAQGVTYTRACTGTRFNHVYHGQSERVLKDGRAQGVTYTRACTGTRF